MDEVSKRDDAKADYLIGKSYKEIAKKYGVSPATVRAWKSRYGWPSKPRKAKRNSDSATQQSDATERQHIATDVFVTDKALTEKQKLFCVYYLQSFNATQSYLKAYGSSYDTAKVNSTKTLANTNIQAYIAQLKEQTGKQLGLDILDLVKSDAKQAFGDIGDYVDYTVNVFNETDTKGKPVRDANGDVVTSRQIDVYFKDKESIDTSIIKSITIGKDGRKIELKDSDKAKERLYRFFTAGSNSGKEQMNVIDRLLGKIAKGVAKNDS
ncbi:terminase small subunit [Fructilactobacillus florum]|uniref:terminase small subunit n=1 Tax=Fructilactobacillus florum TaxID=640331 RepID=UPI0006D250CE|nr:terminase small subunit [Fructilactobacillus florum]